MRYPSYIQSVVLQIVCNSMYIQKKVVVTSPKRRNSTAVGLCHMLMSCIYLPSIQPLFIASLSPPPAAPAQVIRVTCRPDLWAQFGIAHLAPAATQETTEPRCRVKNQHFFSQTVPNRENTG